MPGSAGSILFAATVVGAAPFVMLALDSTEAFAQSSTCALGEHHYSDGYTIRVGRNMHICQGGVWAGTDGSLRANCIYDDNTYSEGAAIVVGRGQSQEAMYCGASGNWLNARATAGTEGG